MFTTTLAPSAETPASSQVTLPPALTTPATAASETSSVHHIRFCYTTFMHAAIPCPRVLPAPFPVTFPSSFRTQFKHHFFKHASLTSRLDHVPSHRIWVVSGLSPPLH